MVINLNVTQSQPAINLKVTLLVENLKNGQFAASIFEFPNFRVEAKTREEAIAQLQSTFLEQLSHIEAISWNVPLSASPPSWMQFAGVFQNDPDFQEIMDGIRSERTSDDDTEVDPSYYL
jgi:predicted RNase H-like HicB family nuclease